MNIQRIRRTPRQQEDERCDFCEEYIQTGYEFSGENVGGPRSGTFLRVCDSCLKRTRSSDIGFWSDKKG